MGTEGQAHSDAEPGSLGRGTMNASVELEMQRLLSALCEGELSEVEHARLEELLKGDADCRRLYLQYMDMHARLAMAPQTSRAAGRLPASAADSPRGAWDQARRRRLA